MEIRPAGEDTVPTVAVVLRTVLQKGRNVALERAKPRKGRFREEIGRREAQGGRGAEGGKVNLPPSDCLIHADGSANFIRPKGPCGTLFRLKIQLYPLKIPLRDAFLAQNTILSAQKAPAGRPSVTPKAKYMTLGPKI